MVKGRRDELHRVSSLSLFILLLINTPLPSPYIAPPGLGEAQYVTVAVVSTPL